MANDNKKQKFNWTKLIITLLLIGGIVTLGWYLIFGFGDHETYKSLGYLQNEVQNDKIKFTQMFFDAEGHLIKVKTNTGESYSVIADYKTISNLYSYMHNGAIFETSGTVDIATGWSNLKTAMIPGHFATYAHVHVESTAQKAGRILLGMLPTLLFIAFMIWLFKKQGGMMGGDPMNQGNKTVAKKIDSKTRFTDVAGQEEAKEEVREVVDFLKRPGKYKAAGARIPKGILLGGPPGTGKTLMAKALAGEAGIPFFFTSSSNFIEMFTGLGAKRVRDMFKEARKHAPSILFIDELDAVGKKRGSSFSGNDEREQTLNQILVEMDGMEETNGLLLIAATNRPDVLDPALTRPGRFDRTITLNLPDIKERQMILELHAKGKRISSDIDFKNIAKRTPRYSGADLESVINESALLAVRSKSDLIEIEHIDEAIDRVAAGPAKKHRVITPQENKLVAIHEAGHAVVGLKVPNADIVQKITIIPRGDAGGYTLMTPEKELYNYKKSQLEAKIMGLLGGRAAEQVYFGAGEVSTGASDDIQKATNIARAMVTQYGMSILGPIAYEKPVGSQFLGQDTQKEYSDTLAERIDEAIRDLIIKAEKKAIQIIKKNKKLLDLIVEELIEKETIVVEEIDYINKNLKRPPKRLAKKKGGSKQSLEDIISEVKTTKQEDTKDN